MLDTTLKYLSLITVAGAAISFVVGLIKYLDQRKREERTTRFKMFHDLMGPIVARGERANEGLTLSHQVAAIYELQLFKDYSYASVPILEDLRARWGNEREAPPLVLKAIDDTLKFLKPGGGSLVKSKLRGMFKSGWIRLWVVGTCSLLVAALVSSAIYIWGYSIAYTFVTVSIPDKVTGQDRELAERVTKEATTKTFSGKIRYSPVLTLEDLARRGAVTQVAFQWLEPSGWSEKEHNEIDILNGHEIKASELIRPCFIPRVSRSISPRRSLYSRRASALFGSTPSGHRCSVDRADDKLS